MKSDEWSTGTSATLSDRYSIRHSSFEKFITSATLSACYLSFEKFVTQLTLP
jgi:hypothetical protein